MTNIDSCEQSSNWRKPETCRKYVQAIDNGDLDNGCVLCAKEASETFEHWKILPNNYPYDRVAEKHDMIVPLRHTNGDDLSAEELSELSKLKNSFLNENYTFIVESLPVAKSIPGHFHLHIITPKEEWLYKD